jgi:hypothetical protein
MKLTAKQQLFLNEVRLAGPDGVVWTKRDAVVANCLLRKGLVTTRLGRVVETDDGRRSGLRFVATADGTDLEVVTRAARTKLATVAAACPVSRTAPRHRDSPQHGV